MSLEDAATQIDTAFTRDTLKGQSYEASFAGALSFLRRRYTKDLAGVDLAVTGIPFDGAVTNRPGARFGPRAIREASVLQTYDPPYGWDVNPMTDIAMCDHGDMAFDYARPADVPGRIRAHVAGILEAGAGVLVLGGDHSISRPVIQAHAARHGPLALVQFDAHSDTWADDDPARNDHGTMFYKAVKEGVIDPAHSIQLGIRTVNPDPLGIATLDAPALDRMDPEQVARAVKERVGARPVYLSFDIDVLDPAFAPGTGTPVAGGISSARAFAILRALAGLAVVGMDVVEVAPPYDPAGTTAITAAHVAMELACLWTHHRLKGAQDTD